MTTRNLDALFAPKSVALIGASNKPGSIGALVARNLMRGGFSGPILPVNPHEAAIGSTLAYPDVSALPQAPDLAILATPPGTIPDLIDQLGRRACRAAVVITAGLDASARQRMLDAARPHLLRIVGPNCLGILSPSVGLNASFAHLAPARGGMALVAQSGAIATAALDWADARGVGFSRIVTLGDTADVDFGDMLDFLALDEETSAIMLYVESISDARKFMSAGRLAARSKPVVVIKAGRSAAGARAAFSHTGAMAGADAVYDAAFRRAGMLRVLDIRDVFDTVSLLTTAPRIAGERLAILTNGGGAGVLAADAVADEGLDLPGLGPDTLAALDRALPATWSRANPVDLIGDAGPERYAAAVTAVMADPQIDALLVMNCPTAVADSSEAADGVIAALGRIPDRKPVLTAWLGETTAAPARRRLAAAGLAVHETPDEAVRAFGRMVQHRRNQAMMMETPPAGAGPLDPAAARRIIDQALAAGRTSLTEPESRALLTAYGVPMGPSRIARTAGEVAAACRDMTAPYALKILSPDISHKSDVGGVVLDLPSAEAAGAEAQAMLRRISARTPKARLEGFIIQPMIVRPRARELICGLVCDPTFGPVVLFGEGGVAAEVRADRAIGLSPLNRVLARDLIRRTRISRLLAPYRDRPGADIDAVAQVLERLSQLALDLPQVAELDINPLLADEDGVIGLDARVRISAEPARRPAIKAYPEHLAAPLVLTDGQVLQMRCVRPQDAPALGELVENTSPADRRLRFHGAMRRLPGALAARLSQIDYDREMALVAETAAGDIVGVARLYAEPDGLKAEFALLVRTDWQAHGLGRKLMAALLDYADSQGLQTVWGSVLAENDNMLRLTDALGFERRHGDDPAAVRVERRRPAEGTLSHA